MDQQQITLVTLTYSQVPNKWGKGWGGGRGASGKIEKSINVPRVYQAPKSSQCKQTVH